MPSDSRDHNIFFPPPDLEKKINHYVQTLSLNIHYFYFYGEIKDDIGIYSDLLNVLHTGTENDTVFLHINSEGGVLRMALQIANAISSTPAKVITVLDGEAISAASIIFLAGHEYIINPNCTFMIHNYSSVIGGKGHELASQIHHAGATVEKIMNHFYSKVLTEKELEEVCKGRDLWMDSDELAERLDRFTIIDKEEDNIVNDNIKEKVTDSVKKKKVSKKKTSRKKDTS